MHDRSKVTKLGLLALGGSSGMVLLFFFAPTEYPFYPRCLLSSLTGISCPGCGSLRALHHLSHGHLKMAFLFNPLLMVALPCAMLVFFCQLFQAWTGRELIKITIPAWTGWAAMSLVAIFTIVRNLPVEFLKIPNEATTTHYVQDHRR